MTTLAKQVETIIRRSVAEALEEEALRLYRRQVEPILRDFDKKLEELQRQLKT